MTKLTHRAIAAVAAPVVALAASVMAAPPASAADPMFPFDWNINATTHMKKLNQTVTVPQGSFTGSVDLVTGDLTGDIKLPKATSTVQLAGIGLVTATFKISQSKPVSGHVDFATFRTTATSVFVIKVVKVSPVLLPIVNLVGDSCRTSKTVKVTMSGVASLTAASTFSGTYTIPPLQNCGLATVALNQVVPGPGNTFTAVASPK
ncbi:MAG: hypothetical protein ACXV8R_10595 [Acidimicrobiia bacterium]